ncbi:Lipase 2 [Cytospora mali]|uniref:Carboxylic ester hydrolase n=1 Tax=Cytospora mali TaxID=578113 RepID=A0A194VA90_CYTMA|nr:Lipase 2 [Valsa mali var. pyri (nom. inval.)]
MTVAVPENGSSMDSGPTIPPPTHQPVTQAGGDFGGDGKDARQVEESAQQSQTPEKKGPWWKTRTAYKSYAVVAAVLLILFVVLLVLGLLGYLKSGHHGQKGTNPHVNLGYATYVGTTLDGDINRFLGMRYAAPPVGDLRWRAPTSPPKSTTHQQATEFGPICLGISATYPSSSEDEDCLFVNVWAPKNASTSSKLPVWLFIQGGGYVTNSNANWDGEEVVRQSGNNIVFVNFNYRVAMWGFLASAKVQANGTLNAGLLDQRFLMEWVQTHIAHFGGDPDNVVIHGASAGAGSVVLHLTAYGGRNDSLFAAGIAESVFFPAQPYVPQLEYQFDRLVNETGCAADSDQLACLRALDTQVLQAQNVPTPFPGRSEAPLPLFYWTPCIDGDFIQDLPYDLLAQGRFVNVPLLFGNDNNEGSQFVVDASTSDAMVNFFQNNYPLLTDNDTAAVIDMYPLEPAIVQHEAWFPSTSTAYGEATFICPAINILNAYSQATQGGSNDTASRRLWLYRYNVIDDDNAAAGLGTPHLWERWAVFGPTNLWDEAAPESYLTYNAPVVPVVMNYFLSFVQTRDPNPLRAPGAPFWNDWGVLGGDNGTAATTTDGNGTRIVLETNNTRMEEVSGAQAERCRFWAGLAPRTQQKKRRDVVGLWG